MEAGFGGAAPRNLTSKRKAISIGALALAVYLLFMPLRWHKPLRAVGTAAQTTKVTVIAHRGFARLYPENTLPAFIGAFEQGADGAELDVQFSADGIPVIIHDPRVDRTTFGSGAVGSMTLSQISNLDAGAKFSEDYKNTKIPTLKEVLLSVRGKGFILVDMKESVNTENVDRLLTDIYDTKMESHVRLMTAKNLPLLKKIRSLDANIPLGEVVAAKQVNLKQLADLGGDVMLVGSLGLFNSDPALAAKAESYGLKVAGWTVEDKASENSLLEHGVSTLISDIPLVQD